MIFMKAKELERKKNYYEYLTYELNFTLKWQTMN